MNTTSVSKPDPIVRLPFVLEANEARSGQLFRFLGETIVVKLSSPDTAGRFVIVEETSPPLSGPPLHQHSREDEWFYVAAGEYRFRIGDKDILTRRGNSLFAPRGVAHTFQNSSSTPSRLLVLVQPAGIEGFFKEMECACAAGLPNLAELNSVFQRYGLALLGPPLSSK